MIKKLEERIAVEAVIVSRKTSVNIYEPKTLEEMQKSLQSEVPLMFGSALFSKLKKKYWEKDHVKGLPFAIAIADFHDTMSMTWTFVALLEYLYGYKYEHSFGEDGELSVQPVKVDGYKKVSGAEVPSGFFFQPDCENVSAVIFSSAATLSKFNRMGKQAGFGSSDVHLIRMGSYHNHDPNATEPHVLIYEVDESSDETWSEGVIIYHNPNALIPLDPRLFDDKVAQCFFEDGILVSVMPERFPYNSITNNNVIVR